MEDILTSIIGISLAAIIMFIYPLMTMSDRTDDISQLTVEIATSEFVEDIRQSGKITPNRYGQFVGNLGTTGNTYNVEIEVKVLDENPIRKKITEQGYSTEKIQSSYYSVYNSQIDTQLEKNKDYYLKEGDIVTVSVKNTNRTMSQQLKNFFYTVIGKDVYVIVASHGGMVIANGK